ncbi:branched-chain amino acid ABC transporter permease [Mesorhizobium australafricanum]|uniref:Branched-chain amino acid ABC transporter permease n=1 Tax=Mesorhizobium australafricanum TaxID=3072311 RepID=A0ABU4X5W3_9HYPH|nr:branched-chain amino acid ABC transporter permease [Mesorhizobium sp. VK3E]MDX8443328.1 branched-chain amino acid ABC transporter permease [Mesorhizobium sp. VK3E]
MLTVQIIINGLAMGASLALVSIGLTLIFSILRVTNFAHGVLYMLGAYTVVYLCGTLGWNYFTALAAAGLLLAACGVLLEVALFSRFHGRLLEGAVMALGVGLFVEAAAWIVFGGTPQSVGTPFPGVWNVGGIILHKHRIFVMLASAVLVGLLYLFVDYTRYGRAMRAMQQNAYAARLQGIDVTRISILTFGLGGALAGLAGGLMAPLQKMLPDMGAGPLLLAFVVIILGGMGSIGGALMAAIFIGMVQSVVISLWTPQLAVGVSFFLAMLILLVRPKGLFGHE